MWHKRIYIVTCVWLLEFFNISVSAQSSLRYTFKPGEKLTYHYKLDATADVMRKRGGGESVTEFETDPEWTIEDVTTQGEMRAILTMRNRAENYRSGHWSPGIKFTPQSEIAMDRNGKLLFARILVDDARRTHTKENLNKIPTLSLAPDFYVVQPGFARLWYTFDTISYDTSGLPHTIAWDSIDYSPYEHDTLAFRRLDTFVTAGRDSIHKSGTDTYTLRDTVIKGSHFWVLHTEEQGKTNWVKYPNYSAQTWNKVSELLFRKEDGILQSWHYLFDTHFNGGTNHSEMTLTLTSMEGS